MLWFFGFVFVFGLGIGLLVVLVVLDLLGTMCLQVLVLLFVLFAF